MGLDQNIVVSDCEMDYYGFRYSEEYKCKFKVDYKEILYRRKDYKLQDTIEELNQVKGDMINECYVKITEPHLEYLEKHNILDHKVIKEAKELLHEGKFLYYYCWF